MINVLEYINVLFFDSIPQKQFKIMGFFDFLKSNTEPEVNNDLNLKFGRFTDSYKTNVQYNAWDLALRAFEEKSYLESYRHFFSYLNTSNTDAVTTKEEQETITFEILQGSKKILGIASNTKVTAISKIAKAKSLNIGFMRKLVELNYTLDYCRFALDNENCICLIFDTSTIDGSPYKLYYALKENALNADKLDDLFFDEFEELEGIEYGSKVNLLVDIQNYKYNFLVNRMNYVLKTVEESPIAEKYPGGNAYLLMSTNYFLDYLISPEGTVMDIFEKINTDYFDNSGKSLLQKNTQIIKDFQNILSKSQEDIQKQLYTTSATFGVTTPRQHENFGEYIDTEISSMDWYLENGHPEIALAVPNYIVGYALFNNALPKPDRDMLDLYIRIMEQAYFNGLGYNYKYIDSVSKIFNKENIIKAIKKISENNHFKYPNFNPIVETILFTNSIEFAKSFLVTLRNCDLTTNENA
jgi:hypothetical protein